MTFRPLSNRVLVRPDDAIVHASELIQIAARDGKIVNSQEQFGRRGVVIAVGPGKRTKNLQEHIPMTVKPGDIVYWGEFMDQTVDLDGQKHFIITDADITGVENASQEINQ